MKSSEKNVNQNYLNYAKSINPRTNEARSLFRAFLIGGLICCIGQTIKILYEQFLGLGGDELSSYVSMTLIFLGAFLTGLGVYDRIGKFAGGGSIVPITGFSNSISSPAVEFKNEGIIYGLCVKMFTIAGPVIVAGIVSSVLVGFIYWIFLI